MTLTGANTYNGTTTISAGVLQIGNGSNSGALGSGAVINNAVLRVSRGGTYEISSAISGTGNLELTTARLILSGANSYSGTTRIDAGGVLNVRNASGLGTVAGQTVVQSGGALEFQGNMTIAESLLLNGTGVNNGGALRNVAGRNTVSGAITLQSDTLITAAGNAALGTDELVLGGSFIGNGFDLTIDGTGRVTANAPISGIASLTQNGFGFLTLGNINLNAPVTVNSGTLRLVGGASVANSVAVTVNGTGNLELANSETIGSLTGTGNVELVSGATLSVGNNNGSTTYAGVIEDGGSVGSLVKTGTGTLTLTGANTYNGTTTISAGVLRVGDGGSTGALGTGAVINNAVLRVSRGGSHEISSAISGTGNLELTTGQLTLSGANSYSGTTRIDAGAVLNIRNGGALGTTAGQTVVQSGGALELRDSITIAEPLSLNGTGIANGGALRNVAGRNTVNGAITLQSDTLITAAGNAAPGGDELVLGGAFIGNGFDLAIGGTGRVTANAAISGVASLTKNGTGTLTLAGANSHTGITNIQSGVLNVRHGAALGATAAGTNIASGAALEIEGSINLSEAVTVGGGGVSNGGAIRNRSGVNSLGGVVTLASDTRINSDSGEFDLAAMIGNGNALTIGGAGLTRVQGPITGLSDFTKDGSGTVLLSGSGNSFSGATRIVEGTLLVAGGSAISDSSAVIMSSGLFGIQSSEAIGSLSGNAGVVRISDSMVLTTGGNGQDTLFAGTIVGDALGTGRLVKTGSGMFTLTGANSYAGGTSVNAGTLRIGNGGTAGSIAGPVSLASAGNLVFDRGDDLLVGAVITGSGTIRQSGLGSLVLAGNNAPAQVFTGSIFVDAGRLAIDGSFGDTVANSARIVVGASGTLGGSGTFWGDVDAQAGTLAPGNSPGTLTIGGNLTLGAATILNFELGESGVVGGPNNDLIVVGGNLTLDGTLNTTGFGAGYGPGYYRLFNYGGTLTDNGLAIGSIAGGYTPTILTNIGGQVNLLLGDGSAQRVQYWDGTDMTGASGATSGNGGAGVWSAGGTNWTAQNGFAVNDAWQSQVAVFGGASGGAVTVEGVQTFQELRFETNGYTLQTGVGGGLATTGGFSVIKVDADLASVNVGISGNGGLTKTGAGTLLMGGASSYAGVTTISEGTLQIAASGSIGGAGLVNAANLVNAGVVNASINNSGSLTSTGIVNGALTNSGSAAIAGQLNGNIGNTGSIMLTGATTGVTALSQTAAGSVNLAGFDTSLGSLSGAGVVQLGGATLAVGSGNGSTSFAGVISGAGGLTKTGTGTLTLNGVNVYTGSTSVTQGVLHIGSTGQIGGAGVTNSAGFVNAGTVNASLVNSGSLASTGIINGGLNNSGLVALAGQLNGSVDNSGAIALTGVTTGIAALTQTAAGSFDLGGFSTTIGMLGGAGSIVTGTNAGTTLTVGNASSSTFVGTIGGNGRLVKTGAGTLTLTGASGHGGGTVISEGSLRLGDGGTTGSVSGPIEVGGTLIIDRSDVYALTNALSGAGVLVQAGSGTTVLSAANGLTGGMVVSNGRLRGDTTSFGANTIRADGTVEFAQAAAGSYASQISGSGVLEKTGAGRLTLTGNSAFSGQTRLLGGELTVNGSLAQSALAVAAGARLSGSGTVGSVTLANGATIAPGNSIGTLNVNGDIVFAAGSTYEVEVDPTGSATDLIAATGRAILNGGSVVHIGLDGNYRPQTIYTILTAAGGIEGAFADVSSHFAFLDPKLGYGPNSVTLTLERNDISFSDIAVTTNQRGVASGVEQLRFGNPLFETVLVLDDGGARLAFDLLSGEIYPSLLSGFVQDSRFVRGAALERMQQFGAAADAEPGVRYWMQAMGSRGHLDGDGNARRFKQDSGGFLMGVDAIADETVQLGAFGGYQQGDGTVHAAASEADIKSYHVGAYVGADMGALGLRAGYAFGWHDADVTRRIAFSSFGDVTTGRFDASTTQAFAEIGYRLDFGALQLEPFAQIARVWVEGEAMNETGGVAALRVARSKMSTAVSTIGARLDQHFSLGTINAGLKLSAGWRHAFDDRLPVASSRFVGSSPFVIAGAPIARDAFAADIGINVALSDRARIDISYNGDVASRAVSHTGRAAFTWAF
ncbi:MAG: autotransporter-associated beta strand repeat-containing protein [Sphingopyxis sp.]|uniref:autotransporter-associated beta strand repeat-containing protein n=1 Tax=Sphingopyxis sp. TaxID=1908224 RepID=UPI002AB98E5A|nr:autotransporter-associated beta strand repeat-containing protein [Sphingopyxis sp.]MDZ3832789.1 autotransporter-associated beta strand repeat-containing protein [Sphingopyxis sp.]